MQQQHLPQGGFTSCFGAQDDDWDSVESILQTLEDSQSLLTGMFKDFIKESQQQGTSAHSRTAGPASASASQPAPAYHAQHQYVQEQHGHALKRSRATELPLNVTLEELYSGTVKRVPVQLRRQDARTGAPVTVMQQLQVCVQPGLHAGTRITLPG
jgi:hypothetical protein